MLCRTRSKLQWSILIVLFISFPLLFTRFHFEYTTQTVQIASHLFDNTRTMEIETTNKKNKPLHLITAQLTRNTYIEWLLRIFLIDFLHQIQQSKIISHTKSQSKLIHINYIAANGHICFCSQHWLSSAHCVNCMSTIPFFHQMYTPYTQFVYFSPLRQICTQRIALYLSHCIHTQTHTSIHPVSQPASRTYHT